MNKKALDAQICYEDLLHKTGITPESDVVFRVGSGQKEMMMAACHESNPFPGVVKLVLLSLRKKAITRLFEEEKVVQTGPAASILAFDAAMGNEIWTIRTGKKNDNPIICDVGFAGLQVVRLYMMAYDGDPVFKKCRYNSATRVDNALNGSFYKYETKDGRHFSAHVYYESQKKKMMQLLGIKKNPDKFTLGSLPFDKKTTAKAIKQFDALDLEEKSFAAGACACMLRDREEWEASEVGKAVCEMPLFRLTKVGDAPKKEFGNDVSRGPLTGVKVLDLTHIIAGPACTRILAEQGADVLLVRRGKFNEQEQAMLELDGWAGKHAIHLDFNKEKDLARVKELITEADVLVCSYQQGALDKFGLSYDDIRKLNPNIINAAMMCFSDSVWRSRPGWAPLAEDITGLSIRNGSKENPVNLNGVPLDYIPGFIMAGGILQALKKVMTEGGSYDLTGSLTRAGYWLHECTDLCEQSEKQKITASSVDDNMPLEYWNKVLTKIENTAVGDVLFPMPATYQEGAVLPFSNMVFTNDETDWMGEKD